KRELELDTHKNGSRLQEIAEKLNEITDSILLIENQIAKRAEELYRLQNICEKGNLELAELEKELLSLDEAIATKSSEQELKEKEFLTKSKLLATNDSELRSLRALQQLALTNINDEEKLNKFNEALAALVDGNNYCILGSILQSPEKYAGGIQSLFSHLLDLIILQKWPTASSATSPIDIKIILEGNGNDRNDNVCGASTDTAEQQLKKLGKELGIDEVIPVLDVLKINSDRPELLETITPLFQGSFLVSTPMASEATSQDAYQKIYQLLLVNNNISAVATFDGKEVITRAGVVPVYKIGAVASTSELNTGVINRNNQIANFEQSLSLLEQEVPALEKDNQSLKALLKEYYEKKKTLENERNETKTKITLSKSQIANDNTTQKNETDRLDFLKRKKGELSQLRVTLLESEEKLKQKLEFLGETIVSEESSIDDKKEELSLLEDNYDSKKEELITLKSELQNIENNFNNLQLQVTDISGQINKLNSRIENNRATISEYQKEIDDTLIIIEQLKDSNNSTAKILASKEDILNKTKDRFHNFMGEMEEEERKIKSLERKGNKLEKDMILVRAQIDQMRTEEEQNARNIFEKYRVNLRKVVGEMLAYTTEE
ncbi:MAG: hypothetical protein HQK53_20100, partial [Oligoflexia bacterium]|nr:hypothetical protein [Oligoflexia bacterium]